MSVPGDGHCLFHALSGSYQSIGINVSSTELSNALFSEVLFNKDYYSQFSKDKEDVVFGVCKVIFNKEYTSPTDDIVIAALCNSMNSTAIIYQYQEQSYNYTEICHDPGRPGVTSNHVVRLVRRGEGLNSHYASTATEKTRSAPLSNESFTPELIRPRP